MGATTPKGDLILAELRLYLSEPMEMGTEAGRISNGKKQARIIYLHSKALTEKILFLGIYKPFSSVRRSSQEPFSARVTSFLSHNLKTIPVLSSFTTTTPILVYYNAVQEHLPC